MKNHSARGPSGRDQQPCQTPRRKNSVASDEKNGDATSSSELESSLSEIEHIGTDKDGHSSVGKLGCMPIWILLRKTREKYSRAGDALVIDAFRSMDYEWHCG